MLLNSRDRTPKRTDLMRCLFYYIPSIKRTSRGEQQTRKSTDFNQASQASGCKASGDCRTPINTDKGLRLLFVRNTRDSRITRSEGLYFISLQATCFFEIDSINKLLLHTYRSRFIPERVAEASQIFLRDAHFLPYE
jgi:hypothetical protein